MSPAADDPLKALREALRLSPDNLPLRKHLAESLLGSGRADEAVKEFRDALARWPDDSSLKLGLARSYFQMGKNSEALVIAEALIQRNDTPAAAYVLHARLLLRAGEAERAGEMLDIHVEESTGFSLYGTPVMQPSCPVFA